MNTRTRLLILTAETLFGFVAAQAQSNLPPLVVKREPPNATTSGPPPSSSPTMPLPTQEELQQAAAALGGAGNPPEVTSVTGAGPQNSIPGTPAAAPSKPIPADYKVKNDVALDATGTKALAISSDYLTKTNVPSQGKDGRVVYTFGSGLPLVVCAPLRLTTIELEPGEKLVAKPQPGDEVRWDIIPSISGAGDGAQTVVFLRPRESGLDTNLILTTDRRLYYLRIVSKPVDYVARVAFAYPEQSGQGWLSYQAEQARLSAEKQEHAQQEKTNQASLNITTGYKFKGPHTYFFPDAVYDDGTFTYITLPKQVRSMDAPVLMVKGPNGLEPVNYDVRNTTYVAHRLFYKAALLSGSGKHSRVVYIISPRTENSGDSKQATETASIKGGR